MTEINKTTKITGTYYSILNKLIKMKPMENSKTRTILGAVVNMPTPGYNFVDELFKQIAVPEFALINGEFKKVAGRYARGEAIWYMSKDRSYKWLEDNKMDKNEIWKGMQDNKGNLNSNYGYRLDLLNNIEEEVEKAAIFLDDKDNKSTPYLITLNIADDSNFKDVEVGDMVCNNRLNIALKISKSTLEVASYTICRSLDISMGLPYDSIAMQGFTLNIVQRIINKMVKGFKGKINYSCNAFIASNLHLYNSNVAEDQLVISGEKRFLNPWKNVENIRDIPYHACWNKKSDIDNPKVSGYTENFGNKTPYVYSGLKDLITLKPILNSEMRTKELKKLGIITRKSNAILKKDQFTRRIAKYDDQVLSYFAKDGQTGEEYIVKIKNLNVNQSFLMHTFVVYDDSETDVDFEEYMRKSRMPTHFHLKPYSSQHMKPLPRQCERLIYVMRNKPASSANILMESLIEKSPKVKYVILALDSPDSLNERKYVHENYNVIYLDNIIFKDSDSSTMSSLCEALLDTMNENEKIWQIQANSFKYILNTHNILTPYAFSIIPSMTTLLETLGSFMMSSEFISNMNLQYSTNASRNVNLMNLEQLYSTITKKSLLKYSDNYKKHYMTSTTINLPLIGFDFNETVVEYFEEALSNKKRTLDK